MPTKPAVLELDMPDDFPTDVYDSLLRKLAAGKNCHPELLREARLALHAVAYRFLACADHSAAFTASVLAHGEGPPQPRRYEQERELFNFFVSGLSCIESTYYGLHAVAGMLDPDSFPMKTAREKRVVTPEKTARRFETRFADDGLTLALRRALEDTAYKQWEGVRNILAHRVTLGRTFRMNVGSDEDGTACYEGVELATGAEDIYVDEDTTTSRRAWLAATVSALLTAIDSFVSRNEDLLRVDDQVTRSGLKPIDGSSLAGAPGRLRVSGPENGEHPPRS